MLSVDTNLLLYAYNASCLLSFPDPAARVMEELWKRATEPHFARSRIYDLRLALILHNQGVTEFATSNEKDFEGLGFRRVWNPLAE